ncbi:MAG TPA: AAA family ATPase [Microthrixaceae bacterium]|nr:AAA family ATPase [Microthrixaceae bacterium]
MTSIVVIDPDEGLTSRLSPSFPRELDRRWPRGDQSPTVESMVPPEAALVVLGPGLTPADQLVWAEQIDFYRPDVAVITCGSSDREFVSAALPLGVRDVLDETASDTDLVAAVGRAHDSSVRRRQTIAVDLVDQRRPQRIITVLSPKGGAGKTTMATNLAVGLARDNPGQVVLVDLDIQFGDVASALRITPEHTVADAVALGGRLDLTTLKVFLSPHSSGLFVLCAPESLVAADDITPDHLKPILTLLAEQFPYVIIDTPAGIRDDTMAALDLSTDFMLVCSTEVPAVKGLQRQVAAFDTVKLTGQRRIFVVNRANARVGLSVADIEATIGLSVDVEIPSSRAVVVSTNQGQPLISSDSRDPARRAFEVLVEMFAPPESRSTVMSNGNGATRRRKKVR